MTDTPLISVIIPSYGRPDSLPRAIQSVLDQSWPHLEVLVVNDNPADSAWFADTNAVKAQFADDPRVQIFADGINRGGGGARNIGISNASGEYISFLDDDDVYFPHKLATQYRHLQESGADVSVCDMAMYRDGVAVSDRKCAANVGDMANFITQGNAFTPMIFCRRRVLTETGMFHDTPRFQDHVLMIKILAAGFVVHTLHEALFIHHDHLGERITLSKKSVLGYQIRHQFEAQHLHLLSTAQRRHYTLKVALLNARIMRNQDRWGAALKAIARAYLNASSLPQFMAVTKRFGSVLLKSRTPF
ncbi:glycosyltransferase family 2 protein [Pantoea sp. 1.19]|uniref:glycosyltransferase family 2 protein n=1 Tax=Pantoea sp. 1.19 TaxID=1925589 RepID=UPI000948E018|nr:glycosyltransferase family 2 protein [Pantoea sp. 1.19]